MRMEIDGQKKAVEQVMMDQTTNGATNEQLDKTHQIKLWQQNHYMTDSGIHSATGTHTPSLSSRVGAEECDIDDRFSDSKPCTFSQWSCTLPAPMNPTDSSLLSPETPSTSSVLGVDSLTDTPGGSHTASNVDLRGNRLPELDTDEAASAIPDLVKLIKDEDDEVIMYQSSMMVFQLSKSEAIDALIKSNEMIECIISALDRTEDPETVRFLSGTLYNMSQTQTGLKAIFALNCVPCLVKLLNSSIESVLFYAITTLHNLLLHQDGAKAVVRQSGCLQKMTSLLQKNNIKFLTICTDCLQILAYSHQESKLQILSSGGPIELVRILRTYQYEKLLWTTVRVLKVLSVCTSNKPAIIAAGGMDAIGKHLRSSNQRLVLNCLWALRNLSDAATKLDNLQPLLHSLVQLLECGDTNNIACSAGILSNLTCNNQSNKLSVFRAGGVQGLLRAVSQVGVKEDILEPCMCALRHLTSRHEDEETARNMIVHTSSGLAIIGRLLHAATAGICPDLGFVCHSPQIPVSSWMLIKALVGLLRNLSVNLDSHFGMRECGLVTGLFNLLYATQYEITKRHTSQSSGSTNVATVVQSVRLEEVVEGICGALHMLAKDCVTRSYLALHKAPNLTILPSVLPGGPGLSGFVQLLYSPNESIQRAAAGLLAEISQDRDGLESLANLPGACTRFEQLAQSRNEGISTYASAVVMRLGEERKGLNGSHCIFSVNDMESLNTPPPMDGSGPYPSSAALQSPLMANSPFVQHYPASGSNGVAQSCLTSGSGWSNYHFSQDPTSMMATSPPPPPQNSLTAMLGPPPTGYKGSNCSGYCPYYYGNCGSPSVGCYDPSCAYTDVCEPSYCGIIPPAPLSLHHISQQPLCYGSISRGGHRLDAVSMVGQSYPQASTTYTSLAPVMTARGETAIPTVPPSVPSVLNQPNSASGLPNPKVLATQRSGFNGSLNTSGYISPSNESYMSNQSPPMYKLSSISCPPRPTKPNIASYNLQPTCTANLPQSGAAQSNTVGGYLSPELMSLDDQSDWLQ